MLATTCERCSSKAFTIIAIADSHHHLWKTHAANIIRYIDDLLGDGMEHFSPQSTDHCANCLALLTEEQSVIISVGAWQRHAMCSTCSEAITDTLNSVGNIPTSHP
jgi:hypothetical protein